jgi:hypothetical protein
MASDMTYSRCDHCGGIGRVLVEKEYGWERTACPCVRSESPGWSPTGVTVRQLERMAERERCLSGDPGVPLERRLRVLTDLRNRLDRAFGMIPVKTSPPADDPAELYRELGGEGG